MQLVEHVDRRGMDRAGSRGHSGDRSVNLRRIDGSARYAVSQYLNDAPVRVTHGLHLGAKVGLDLVDPSLLLGCDANGLHSHHEEACEARVMMAVLSVQLRG